MTAGLKVPEGGDSNFGFVSVLEISAFDVP